MRAAVTASRARQDGRHPGWLLGRGRDALAEGLARAGRSRSDIHWNARLWVAIGDDRAELLDDARGTVAFYAGMQQYEPMFAAQGFGDEARACADALARGDMAGWVGAVTDEMAETFVVLGDVDTVRRRVEDIWDVADSFCLVAPVGGLAPEKIVAYTAAIGETFYS